MGHIDICHTSVHTKLYDMIIYCWYHNLFLSKMRKLKYSVFILRRYIYISHLYEQYHQNKSTLYSHFFGYLAQGRPGDYISGCDSANCSSNLISLSNNQLVARQQNETGSFQAMPHTKQIFCIYIQITPSAGKWQHDITHKMIAYLSLQNF